VKDRLARAALFAGDCGQYPWTALTILPAKRRAAHGTSVSPWNKKRQSREQKSDSPGNAGTVAYDR